MALTPRYRDIVLRVVPSHLNTLGKGSTQRTSQLLDDLTRSYDAVVYANENLPDISAGSDDVRKRCPERLGDLFLTGVEQISINWRRYQTYLAMYVEGDKTPSQMRSRLMETLSPGLASLLWRQAQPQIPTRLWWDLQAPELRDLPWELMAYGRDSVFDTQLSDQYCCVRGAPSTTPPPLVPIQGPLRLALIHDPQHPPEQLINTLQGIAKLKVIPMRANPRAALEIAAKEGYELVHMVVDGIVSLAYEGSLYLFDSYHPELPAAELSAIVRGSRIAVLGLSAQEMFDPDRVSIGNRLVPSVYRAFAYLGSSTVPLPNIVAPTGPIPASVALNFWHGFYTSLAETLSSEVAVVRGQNEAFMTLPIALFLRHTQGRLFLLEGAKHLPVVDPSELNADLQSSRELLDRFDALAMQYGDKLPPTIAQLIDEERAYNRQLQAKLYGWVQLAEEE